MQIYLVGGAVRDRLLGLPVQDRDWVVVGATPQQMVAQGFLPVGKDFPVFLHPRSKEQYALARTERKTAPGYRGFAVHAAPDVTLEQDLARRDLSINAIAIDARHVRDDGSFDALPQQLVDPFHGQRDLQGRLLRHVGAAFPEDPVRILRVARFAARFADFRVAGETTELMRAMVGAGEVAALVAERVWQELARGLMERTPSRMFAVLQTCGAFAALMPELDALWFGAAAAHRHSGTAAFAEARALRALDRAAARGAPLAVRFSCLWQADGAPRQVPAFEARSTQAQVPTYEAGRTHTQVPTYEAGGTRAQVPTYEAGDTHTQVTAPPTPGTQASAPVPARAAGATFTSARTMRVPAGRESDAEAALARLCERLRVPVECRALAQVALRECRTVQEAPALDAKALTQLLERCDAFRKPERFGELLDVCACARAACGPHLPPADGGVDGAAAGVRRLLLGALTAARGVDTAAVAAQAQVEGMAGPQIAERIHAARVNAVAAMPRPR